MEKVKTDIQDYDLTEIPLEADIREAKVFREGSLKYGMDNWVLGAGNNLYQIERANHALKHLRLYIHKLKYHNEHPLHEKGEDDLAKVRWFCSTQMEIERLEREDNNMW